MTPPLRLATSDDCEEVLRLAHLMWDDEDINAPPGDWENAYRDVFNSKLNTDEFRAFVADDPVSPHKLIACGAAWTYTLLPAPWLVNGKMGYLQWFSVEREWRRKGLGLALLDAGRDWLMQQGCTRIQLHSAPKAISLYERNGFELNDSFPNMWFFGQTS